MVRRARFCVRYVVSQRSAFGSPARGLLYSDAVFYRRHAGASGNNGSRLHSLPRLERTLDRIVESANRTGPQEKWLAQFHRSPRLPLATRYTRGLQTAAGSFTGIARENFDMVRAAVGDQWVVESAEQDVSRQGWRFLANCRRGIGAGSFGLRQDC